MCVCYYIKSTSTWHAYPFQNIKFMILPFSPRSKLFNCNISSGVSWKSKICNRKFKKWFLWVFWYFIIILDWYIVKSPEFDFWVHLRALVLIFTLLFWSIPWRKSVGITSGLHIRHSVGPQQPVHCLEKLSGNIEGSGALFCIKSCSAFSHSVSRNKHVKFVANLFIHSRAVSKHTNIETHSFNFICKKKIGLLA
jgi:hypothetical protein